MWEHERKLNRAAEHFEQLKAQIEGWEKGHGYTLSTVPHHNPPHYAVRVEIDRPIEDEPFPLVLGDFLQNARSALDYLAGALGDVGAGGVMDERDALVTMFPIARNPERFAQLVKGHLPTVSEPVRAIIEEMQPYETGGDIWVFEPLWILNELARFDRHRFLHLGYERIGDIRLNHRTSGNVRPITDFEPIRGLISDAELEGLEESEFWGGEDTAILATFTAFPVDPSQKMHMDWEGAIQITFDPDRLPNTLDFLGDAWSMSIPWALRGIVPDIREVFRALAPFLPVEPPRW
jgi:hypothetical protein